jgi:hypothetical protein
MFAEDQKSQHILKQNADCNASENSKMTYLKNSSLQQLS